MRKKGMYSLNQKMVLALVCMVILPLLIIGFAFVQIVYRSEIKAKEAGYQEKMEWAVEQTESFFQDGENFALTLYVNPTAQKYLKKKQKDNVNEQEIAELMYHQVQNKDWYKSICISMDGEIFKQWSQGTILEKEDMDDITRTYESEEYGYWTKPRILENTMRSSREYKEPVLTFYGKIFDFENIHNIIGVVSVSLSEDYLSQIYSNILAMSSGIYMLVDQEGDIISSNDKSILGKEAADYRKVVEGYSQETSQRIKVNGKKALGFYKKSERYGWYMLSVIPEESLVDGRNVAIYMILLGIGLCIVFGVVFGFIMRKSVLLPIMKLADTMRHADVLENDYYGQVYDHNEIGVLQQAFVEMERNIHTMIQQNYVSEICRKEAELQMLVSQINPHFLYNVLDSIYWKAAQNKDYIVAERIALLSDMFRYTLKTDVEYVTMEEEIEMIKKYAELIEAQSTHKPSLFFEVEESLLNVRIPKLLLQPLVENAYVHGFQGNYKDGCIGITAETSGNLLSIIVSDNGAGTDEKSIEHEITKEKQSRKAFALQNVDKRIKLIYGNEYGITFRSSVGEGTTVIVRLPLEMRDGS